MTYRMTPFGKRTVLTCFVVCAVLAYLLALATPWLVCVPLSLLVFVLAFFRDPARVPPGGEGTVVAPADGKVTDIVEVDEQAYIGKKCVKIGIFMSLFNVHINRSSLAGRVEFIEYTKGKFLNALNPRSAFENENNAVGIACDERGTLKILVRQVAGVIARTIVCSAKKGDLLARGERIGMIKFGSRVEVYVPLDAGFEVSVAIGDSVRGGETVLGLVKGK